MDAKKIFIENGEAFPAVIVGDSGDTPPTNCSDLTSIENWDKYSLDVSLDYLQIRWQIQYLVVAIVGADFSNWAGLTQEQKEIACKWCVAPYALRVSVISDSEDKENWKELLIKSKGNRLKIVELMRERIGDDLRQETITNDQSNRFYEDTQDLLLEYGFTYNPKFYNWLTGALFAGKDYYTEQRKNELVDIYNGNY